MRSGLIFLDFFKGKSRFDPPQFFRGESPISMDAWFMPPVPHFFRMDLYKRPSWGKRTGVTRRKVPTRANTPAGVRGRGKLTHLTQCLLRRFIAAGSLAPMR